ncbi:MAG: protein-methionine-sulfoxide reductase catalytic subunit MsrP [Rhodobacteraceae bacterium]|nr:protein-methionine-sulfoxide reductase catalytic subunit MsrP [Paracoccaceae bacterium]
MAYRWTSDLTDDDVTPLSSFMNRRQIIAGMAGVGLGAIAGPVGAEAGLDPNTWEEITNYNNFYEFGTGKEDPAQYAHQLTTSPWKVTIDGMVDRPGEYSFDDIMSKMKIEKRIYRFRCVETWSMVVPWNGFELADLLNMAGVKSGAEYVAFETLLRPSEMPGTRHNVLDWPYVEGLRLDEAMNPLTIMATGIYNKPIPNQNGAPLRLVVPWKYGYKSIKSIVKITLMDKQPPTSWGRYSANEYGFYSNVNPEVSHPRWSQASEKRIGGGLLARKMPTLMFNGYENEVAAMYKGMDLSKHH